MWRLSVLAALTSLVLPAWVLGTTIYVDDDNTIGPWDGTAEHPYLRIRDGVSAAINGETVLVRDVTYSAGADFDGKAITVRSENGPSSTIVDCNGTPWGFDFTSHEGPDSVLDGFTIQNAGGFGGSAIYCYSSSPTITRCTILDNTSTGYGPGIHCRDDSDPVIGFCTISGNTADAGAGIACRDYCDPVISNSVIAGNTAQKGGGIYCEDTCRPVFTNCALINNAASEGGGLYCIHYCDIDLTTCTVAGNTAVKGGGICCIDLCSVSANRSVLWANDGYDAYVFGSDPILLVNCDVETRNGHMTNYVGSLQADPKFRALDQGDFHLLADSPCIDAISLGPTNDIDGETRPAPAGGSYDIGADEYVDADGDGMADWWETAYFDGDADPAADSDTDGLTNLDEYGLVTVPVDDDSDGDGLLDGDEVNVHGTNPLSEDTDGDGLLDDNELLIYGTQPADADSDDDGRTDSWEIAWGSDPLLDTSPGTVRVYVDGRGDDACNGRYPWRLVGLNGPKASIQAGINVTADGDEVLVAAGTYAGDGNRDLDFQSKAIVVRAPSGAGATVIDCGGTETEPHRGVWFGPYGIEGQVVEGFTIRNGYADYGGGVHCARFSKPTVRACVIMGNTAAGGGGVYCEYDSSPTIEACTILGNTAGGEGGGLDCWFSEAVIVNCLIAGNTAEWGGGMCHGSSDAMVLNCTIAQNTADHAGGAYCYHSYLGGPTLLNSILWNDAVDEIVADYATPLVSFCDVLGGWPGHRNIATDPLFVNAGSGDFHLQGDSPCFDTADADTAPFTDLDGTIRPWGWGFDIGAYEFVGTDLDGDDLPDEWEERYFGHFGFDGDDDPDGDGLTNEDEGAAAANPDNPDTDGDGLNDGDEVDDHGTDPLAGDTDGDGLDDEYEVAHGLDPLDATDALRDLDGDGLLNAEEHRFGSDPQDQDSPAFVYVDDDRAGSAVQDGTKAHPYGTIGQALGAAVVPAVIKVLPGVYAESADVPDGIWLIGAGAFNTNVTRVYLNSSADGVVAGFTASNPGAEGIYVRNSTATIRDCVCTASGQGIRVKGTGAVRLVNCLVTANTDAGIILDEDSQVDIVNCTVADNVSYGVAEWYAAGQVRILDSILWNNGDDLSGSVSSFFTDIGDGDFAGFDANISADPIFVAGPLHGCYLSQIAAGQLTDGPCLDAASTTADAAGVGRLTTRSDDVRDLGAADMGYHAAYPLRIWELSGDGVSMTVRWNAQPGLSYSIEWSTDRQTWHTLPVGPVPHWVDEAIGPYVSKFYRVREQ